MSDKLRIRTGLHVFASLAAFAASFGLGACFDGFAAVGLPCTNDAQCGPKDSCIEGYCGGQFACGDGEFTSEDVVCDGMPDCPNGADEEYVMCFGDAESFECADGTLIPVTLHCDGSVNCRDGDDEDPAACAGVGVNQCGVTDGDLGYTLGPSHPLSPPLPKLEVAQVIGTQAVDVIVTSVGGDQVKIVSFDESDMLPEFYLNGPPPSFGGSVVVDVELGLVTDGDAILDLVVATTGTDAMGTDAGIYVFENNAGMPPAPFGVMSSLADLMDAEIVGIELGKLDSNAGSDIAVIVDLDDVPNSNGQVFVAVGAPAVAEMGGAYFSFDAEPVVTIAYTTFLDSGMADLDNDGDDDLLVSGFDADNEGALWLIRRTGEGGAAPLEFDAPEIVNMPKFVANEIVIGKFSDTMAQGFDLALLDTAVGRIQTMRNESNMLAPGQQFMLTGAQFSGLTMADMNCDGAADYLYNVGSPAQVHVLLGDGMGGASIESPDPLIYASEGFPRGGLAVTTYDADSSPDIVSAVDIGEGVTGAEVRLLLTGSN